MTDTLKRTALYQWHLDHGARMVPFAGWEMPVQYPTGPIEEHHTTRRAAGLFDIDPMGQIDVRGPDAEAFVNWLVTHDIRRMKLFDAHYALMCYADGGVVDGLFVYKLPDRSDETGRPYFFLAVNASNRQKDVEWAKAHMNDFDVTVRDLSDETYMLAFQGPQAPAILNRLTHVNLDQVARFTAITGTLFENVPVLLDELRGSYEDDRFWQCFDRAKHAPVLVLDDLGIENATPWAREKLFQIIDYRYVAKLPTIITIHREAAIDARIQSRIFDLARSSVNEILAPSFRTTHRRTQAKPESHYRKTRGAHPA